MKKRTYHLVLIMLVGAFALGACGSAASKATPTATPLSVEAISTAAAQTVIAQLTQQAPTITPTPVVTDTPIVTATRALQNPTATRLVPTSSNCANAAFVSDVTIPDGTVMAVGQTFTKTWRMQNTGTCAWTTSFKLVYFSGDAMGGQSVALPNAVSIGQNVDISVNLTVPNKTGKLEGIWTLMDDKGQNFGGRVAVRITVGTLSPTPTGSATVTPTKTLTPTLGSTSTSTSTQNPTATSTPTETPIPTETPTETPTSAPT